MDKRVFCPGCLRAGIHICFECGRSEQGALTKNIYDVCVDSDRILSVPPSDNTRSRSENDMGKPIGVHSIRYPVFHNGGCVSAV